MMEIAVKCSYHNISPLIHYIMRFMVPVLMLTSEISVSTPSYRDCVDIFEVEMPWVSPMFLQKYQRVAVMVVLFTLFH